MNSYAMYNGAKYRLWLPVMFTGILLISACDDDLTKIQAISAKLSSSPIEKTTGVDIIYSDSAKVKLRLIAPLLLQHHDPQNLAKEYDLMPKGVRVIFYDTTRHESGGIVADTGINHSNTKIIEFHKNVVATNAQGETFKSDELIWDQNKKVMYSNKPVQITMNGGNVMNGINFTSDEKLTHPIFGKSTGVFHVSDMPGNQ